MNDRHPSGDSHPPAPSSDADFASYTSYDQQSVPYGGDAGYDGHGGGYASSGGVATATTAYAAETLTETSAYTTDGYATGGFATGSFTTDAYSPSTDAYSPSGGSGASGNFESDPLFGDLPGGTGPTGYDAAGSYGTGSWTTGGTPVDTDRFMGGAEHPLGAVPYDPYGTQQHQPQTGFGSGGYDSTGFTKAGFDATGYGTAGQWEATAWTSTGDQWETQATPDHAAHDYAAKAVPAEDSLEYTASYDAVYDPANPSFDNSSFDNSSYDNSSYEDGSPEDPAAEARHHADGEPEYGHEEAVHGHGHAYEYGHEYEHTDDHGYAYEARADGENETEAEADADPAVGRGRDDEAAGTEPEADGIRPAPSRAAGRTDRGRSRRRPAKRSALLTVAVPSVCVIGVAGAAAASVGSIGGGHDKTAASVSQDPTAVKPSVANNQLDTQLENLSADAGDFADRASRTQERIDLKAQQEAERKKAAEEAERKERLRPKFVLPVTQHGLSAYFGQAGDNWMTVHTGIDFPVAYGTQVMAATDGTLRMKFNPAYGNMAILTAPDGTETWYCHLSSYNVSYGTTVKAGDVIAFSGNSGNSTGPHLHFEVRPGGGAAVDPLPWLRAHGLDPT